MLITKLHEWWSTTNKLLLEVLPLVLLGIANVGPLAPPTPVAAGSPAPPGVRDCLFCSHTGSSASRSEIVKRLRLLELRVEPDLLKKIHQMDHDYYCNLSKSYNRYAALVQGSLQLGGHGVLPNLSEIPPNQMVTRFVSSVNIIITKMWFTPKVFLSNQADQKISAKITKPSKKLERTLP